MGLRPFNPQPAGMESMQPIFSALHQREQILGAEFMSLLNADAQSNAKLWSRVSGDSTIARRFSAGTSPPPIRPPRQRRPNALGQSIGRRYATRRCFGEQTQR